MRGGRESPRVFGPCLSSSFVPKLRLFSWPSFSRFVHPWAQGRAQARKRKREKENDSEDSGKEDEACGGRGGVSRNMVERRKKRRGERERENEEGEEGGRVRTGKRG